MWLSSHTVPVRKKGITSVLLTSFANKDTSRIERVTYDTNSHAKTNANNEFYIGKFYSVIFDRNKKKM